MAGLILLMAAFGREFSKIELGFSWLHPTEVLLGLVLVVALGRTPPSEWLERLRRTGALIPLLVLWAFGAVATFRGLSDWGFSLVLHDIGLVEYSILIPILALVVRNRDQFAWLCRTVAFAGLLAMGVQAATLWTPLEWGIAGQLKLVLVASGLYVGIFVIWPLAHRAAGVAVPPWQYFAATVGVILIVLGVARAAWVGLLVSIVIVIAASASRARLATAGVAAAVVLFGVLLSIPAEEIHIGTAPARDEVALDGGAEASDGGAEASGGPSGPSAVREVTASLGATSQSANANWRLDFWGYMLDGTADQPITGVGFGRPANFEWNNTVYDSRDGGAGDPFDVSGPHNSFVNALYRMGVPGFLAIAAIMALAVAGLARLIRRSDGENRAVAIWLLAALAIATALASFSVALEGPFMGLFFWAVLGLGLLAPQMLGAANRDR